MNGSQNSLITDLSSSHNAQTLQITQNYGIQKYHKNIQKGRNAFQFQMFPNESMGIKLIRASNKNISAVEPPIRRSISFMHFIRIFRISQFHTNLKSDFMGFNKEKRKSFIISIHHHQCIHKFINSFILFY